MPLNVCLYITAFPAGGAERQIVNLARELAGRGNHVVLLHGQKDLSRAHYLETLEGSGVEVVFAFTPAFLQEGIRLSRKHPDFYAPIPAPGTLKMGILHLAGALVHFRTDVVHSYLDVPNCAAGCAALLADVPAHLGSFRNIDPATAHNSCEELCRPLYQYLLLHGRSRFEANSRLGAERYARWLGMDPEAIAYSPNGLDPEGYAQGAPDAAKRLRGSLGIPASAPVLLTLGRFCPAKAPEAMLDIFTSVRARRPEARYIIAGTGMSPEEEMGALTRERGLTGAVHLLGVRSDAGTLLACADVFLLPSRFEGFPNAIMEAMAAGLPVVASNVGGIPDLVRNGEDGFLHDARAVEGMAASALALLDDAELRCRFGENARQRIRNEFTLKKLGDRVIQRYEALLADADHSRH